MEFKKIENITFQFCASPESLSLEFLDENNNAFMDIEYNDNKEYKINFYKSEDHISLPLQKIWTNVLFETNNGSS